MPQCSLQREWQSLRSFYNVEIVYKPYKEEYVQAEYGFFTVNGSHNYFQVCLKNSLLSVSYGLIFKNMFTMSLKLIYNIKMNNQTKQENQMYKI